MSEHIICEICQQKFRRITNSHLRDRHGISLDFYRKKYPGSPLSSIKSKFLVSESIKSMYNSGELIPYERTDEIKEKIKTKLRGISQSPEFIEKRMNSLRGKKRSQETREKMSISQRKQILKNKMRGGQVFPMYNKKACNYFNDLMIKTNTNIQHAENGGEFLIKDLGLWVDGYDKKNNIVYEYDEKHHFNKDGTLREADKKRQKIIESRLKCKFIRIKDI